MKPLFLLLLGAASAFAQPITFGVKAGVPLTDFYETVQSKNFGFNSNTKNYIIGPTVELRLPFGFGVEFDALYRHPKYSGTSDSTVSESVSANSWEFPLLAKYRFPTEVIRPFVTAGVAFQSLSDVKHTILTTTGLSDQPATTQNSKGFVMGGGVDIHALVLHISPQVRYTHWGSTRFVDPLSLVRSSDNQAEFLLGITF